MISAAWALALPVNGTYDEKHHIVRAYAVAEGHWLPDGPASDGTPYGTEGFDVPASLLPGNLYCVVGAKARGSASCQVTVASREKVRTPSAAARYSPVYYLPVGLPLLVSPDRAGVVAARLVSALLGALLLAAALATAVRLGSRMLVAGVALVSTPLAMNLIGSVNPNGLEIAAGVLVFVTFSALLDGVASRRMLVLAGVAAALLLTVRQLGPVLFVVDVVACGLLAGRGRVAALWRSVPARWLLGGFVLAGLAVAGGWAVASGGNDQPPVPGHAIHGDIVRQIVSTRIPFYVKQIVGQFGYGEIVMSPYLVLLWYLLCLAVVVPALVWAGWRLRLVAAGLLAFCAVLLVALDLRYAPRSGWFAQGRYAMPTLAGVVLLAALAWQRGGLAGGPPDGPPAGRWGRLARSRWPVVALVGFTAPVHLYALARAMTRFSAGLDASLNPFAGSWRPVAGPAVPLAAAVVGLAVLVAVARSTALASSSFTTYRGGELAPGTVSGELNNGSVTPIGQTASRATKASTTDAGSH
nr:DUF2142 domain-containing protein [Planosporangium thailandense]